MLSKTTRSSHRPRNSIKRAGRLKLTVMLLKLFELWQLTTEEKLSTLGMPADYRSVLKRYAHGQAIPGDRDTIDRASHLIAIHQCLRLLFPNNRELAYGWMKTKNKSMHGYSPIEMIDHLGFSGLLIVHRYLSKAVYG